MADRHFGGRVAVVTGAGRGLGRAYALLLGRLGASVVVNNRTREKAVEVVEELQRMGAQAVADSHDVATEGEKVIDTAITAFGRIDIVVNNAGQLRDRSFKKMAFEEWEDVIATHLHGTFRVTRAAWPLMEKQGYGRIVMVSSMSAVAGNMGQANYSAAKGAVTTLAQTLALEGARSNIVVNAVATAGLTRMTERFGTHIEFTPEKTALGVVYFCHEACKDSGGFYRVEGGTIYKLRYQAAAAKSFDTLGAEDERAVALFDTVLRDFEQTANFDNQPRYPVEGKHAAVKGMRQVNRAQKARL